MHIIVPLIFPCSVQILLENASISAYYILRSLLVEEFFLVTKGFSFFLFFLGFFVFFSLFLFPFSFLFSLWLLLLLFVLLALHKIWPLRSSVIHVSSNKKNMLSKNVLKGLFELLLLKAKPKGVLPGLALPWLLEMPPTTWKTTRGHHFPLGVY